MMQASIQHYVDAAISSTINLKEEATPKEIVEGILLANHLGLKGVTFYRENCARTGILTNLKEEEEENDTCPDCGGIMMHMGGCSECQECGFSLCSL
jgi:ribonucleoside-diphosphate reductase alpha chain